MAFVLGPEAAGRGYRLATYETIGSTSAEASVRGRAGDPGRLWVAAQVQTAGHGRRGRGWETPRGNLAASLLMPVAAPPDRIATLGFAAGLALVDAIRSCSDFSSFGAAERETLRLKWPNDVLIDGAKVAGILLETVAFPGDTNGVVVGFGVNVRHAPEGLPYPATSLAVSFPRITAESLFTALAEAWVEQLATWDEGRGFRQTRRHWLDRAAGLGAPIAVRAGGAVFRGAFETIDEDGQLVLKAADGSARRIAAGDVHFGIAATMGR